MKIKTWKNTKTSKNYARFMFGPSNVSIFVSTPKYFSCAKLGAPPWRGRWHKNKSSLLIFLVYFYFICFYFVYLIYFILILILFFVDISLVPCCLCCLGALKFTLKIFQASNYDKQKSTTKHFRRLTLFYPRSNGA